MWGNSLTTRESVPQPFRYSGELWDNTTSLQYLRARWYDPSMGRFINEDTYEGQIDNPLSLNLYTYVQNNPLTHVDPSGHEGIVLSGSHRSQNAVRQFIEPAIKQINDIATCTSEKDIVWMVADSGYSDTDKALMMDAANQISSTKDVTVTLLFATSKQQIIDHFNSGRDRSTDKISMLRVFSHGKAGELSLGLGTEESLNIGLSDISSFNSSSFSSTFNTTSYACNTGTENSTGQSFAQSWADQTGGSVLAATNGKTEYTFINNNRGWLWNVQDKFNRSIGINIDTMGSNYYPILDPKDAPNVHWQTFTR